MCCGGQQGELVGVIRSALVHTSSRPRSHACPACIVRCCVQVPLMAALPTAQAAMDAHRGVAAVAEHWLGFLRSLAVADANQVNWWT